SHGRLQYQTEGDEADVDDKEIWPLREASRIERADIGLFERRNSMIIAQTGVQLVTTHVDRVDAACPTPEQQLGEASGRRTDVEADATRRIEIEMAQCSLELDASARDEGMFGARP